MSRLKKNFFLSYYYFFESEGGRKQAEPGARGSPTLALPLGLRQERGIPGAAGSGRAAEPRGPSVRHSTWSRSTVC